MADTNVTPDTNQDAIQLDDLTVLSKVEGGPEGPEDENLTDAPPAADESGNENIQSTQRQEVEGFAQEEEGGVEQTGFDIGRATGDGDVFVPPISDESAGQQIPVPLIDQPLPQAEVAFDNPGPERNPPPEPQKPPVVTPIGAEPIQFAASTTPTTPTDMLCSWPR